MGRPAEHTKTTGSGLGLGARVLQSGKKEQALADLGLAYQQHDIGLLFLNVDHA